MDSSARKRGRIVGERQGRAPAKKVRRDTRDAPRSRATELETEWEDLLEKENNLLLNRLVEENRVLELMFQQFQAKMESIILCSKEALESMQNVPMDNKICAPQRLDKAEQTIGQGQEPSPHETTVMPVIAEQPASRGRPPVVSLSPSIIYRAAALSCRSWNADQGIVPNELCEDIMAWKVRSGQCWDFRFLLNFFQWNDISALLDEESTVRLLHAPNFYSLLLDSVLNGTDLNGIPCTENSISVQNLNSVTMLASVAHFWLVLNFLVFLTFPTEGNLRRIPKWLWPTKQQFLQDHPGLIDLLAWPGIRSALVVRCESYQLSELMVDLFQSLELQGATLGVDQALIRTTSDGIQLEIEPAFEETIADLGNHRIGPEFFQKYPELAQCAGVRIE